MCNTNKHNMESSKDMAKIPSTERPNPMVWPNTKLHRQQNTKTTITNTDWILYYCFGPATKNKIRKREKFEDAKGVTRSRQLNDRHSNDQMGKHTNRQTMSKVAGFLRHRHDTHTAIMCWITNNVNKAWALLQTTRGKDEPNIVSMWKS